MSTEDDLGATAIRALTNAVMVSIANPPLVINALRRLAAPAVVCTRHELGERYYRRLGGLVRLYTYFSLALPSAVPLLYGGAAGPICFAVGWAISWVALVWFFRCDRQCRREIATRRHTGAVVNSWSAGIPRFGANNETTNRWKIPCLLVALGILFSPFTFAFGCYLAFCGLALWTEANYRRRLAREAALDEQDRIGASQGGGMHEASLPDVPTAKQTVGSAGSPLEGFGEILSEP